MQHKAIIMQFQMAKFDLKNKYNREKICRKKAA